MTTHRHIQPRDDLDAMGEARPVSANADGRATGRRWTALGEELIDLGRQCAVSPRVAEQHRDRLAELFAKEAAALGAVDFERVIRPVTRQGQSVFSLQLTHCSDSDTDPNQALETVIRHLQSHGDMRVVISTHLEEKISDICTTSIHSEQEVSSTDDK